MQRRLLAVLATLAFTLASVETGSATSGAMPPKPLQAASATAESWIAKRKAYKPPDDRFPQIIQRTDYATIEAIESWDHALAELGPSDFTANPKLGCVVSDQSVEVTAGAKRVDFRLENGGVRIGGRLFTSKETVELFRTLRRLLKDVSKDFACKGVKFSQMRTRAYKARTTIEFNFSPVVVVVDGFSNGVGDPERLYVLDVTQEKDSLFWGRR